MTQEWTDVSLGELLDFSSGKAIAPGGEGAFPAFGSNGLIGRSPNSLFSSGIIIGRVGAYCGSVALSQHPFWASDNTIVARPKSGDTDLRFAYYLLINARLNSWAGGAAQPLLTQSVIKPLRFPIPSLPVQGRIASILGAYDDLIEVNRRRIAVLEEMARRLFEEWFVHFRFPGHQGSLEPAAEGPLPTGWSWQRLSVVCERRDGVQTGPFGSQLHKSDYSDEGVPVVMPKNIIGLRVVEDGIAHIPVQLADALGRHRMRVGDVVYGRRGDIGRRAYISKREDGWFCGTGCLRLRPDSTIVAPRYLFDALGLEVTFGAIKARAQGATMPNLSAGAMAGVPVMVPPFDLQQRYAELVEPLADLGTTIANSNDKLAASRDLLLPRLISGELSVTAAERELENAA